MNIVHIKNNRGLTLVELMVSVTVGLIIMSGVLQLYASSLDNSRTVTSSVRIQDNMRYALSMMGDDIAQAGNIKCDGTNIVNTLYFGTAQLIQTLGHWQDFDDTYVSGNDRVFNAANPFTTSDTLIIKRVDYSRPQDIVAITPVGGGSTASASIQVNDADNLSDGEIAIAGDCGRMVVLELDVDEASIADVLVDPDQTGTVNLINPAAQVLFDIGAAPILYTGETGAYTYSIGATTGGACTDTDIRGCSLFRQKNNEAVQEIVQGVHSFQVEYGVETSPGVVQYQDGFADGGNEERIDRVRVTLQFNSAELSGNTLSKTVTRVFSVKNAWE